MSGVETIKPIGPQSQLQNMAAMTTDSGDRPVVCPYSCGSTSCPAMSSTIRKRLKVASARNQPGSTAAASNTAQSAAIQIPT